VEPTSSDPFTQRLFAKGNAFERAIFTELLALHPGTVVITEHGRDAEAATVAAMQTGVPLILAGRLPPDQAGRRLGRPDVLITATGGGYRAVDVKWHQTLGTANGNAFGLPGICSSLDAPSREDASLDEEYFAKRREEDVLQLAHYQRILEAIGMQAVGGCWGGIVGTERRVVWYDLDAPIWRTPSSTGQTKLRSTMARYDFEFDFRLDVVAVAEKHKRDPSVALLTVPVKVAECESCPWWDYCRPQLERPPGDVSLLPRIGWTQWKIHRDHGVTNRAELATLDPRTARLVASGLDIAALMAVASDVDLAFVLSKGALRVLASEGITTARELHGLCARTASYSDVGLGTLPVHIDLARAALGPQLVYRKRGISDVTVPRADVEIDVDMENTELGCYLWGSFVTNRSTIDITAPGYRAFATWAPLTAASEAQNTLQFWEWLVNLRRLCQEAGLTFAVYCYNASAENTYLRRLGIAYDRLAEPIETFIASCEWIDLLKEWDRQLITGSSSALKRIGSMVGFEWGVIDAGGGESMIKHDLAADGDEAARQWLLTYNQGDVEATLAIREWMAAAQVPGVEEA
jgi:predicted RecB family nuclease